MSAQPAKDPTDVLIVGAGHAGVALVAQLVKAGHTGSITVVDAQNELPYERPPLSKGYLLGDVTDDELLLRRPDYWRAGHTDLRLGVTVTGVDPAMHTVTLDTGELIGYRTLVWATGAAARRLPLPGADAPNVLSARTLDDIRRLAALTEHADEFVLIGGGYIGLETAASLAKLHKQVTVLEAQDRLLARVTGPTIAGFLRDTHLQNGVQVHLSARIEGLEQTAGNVTAVLLDDGTRLPADVVIVGIGVEPRLDVLQRAGVAIGNGVLVDPAGRTNVPEVFAIGDVAATLDPASGTSLRLESVPNVTEHAKRVAAALTISTAPVPAVPWFWSNQYDVRLQTAGVLTGYDREVVRPSATPGGLVVGYFAGEVLIAADCVNSPRDFAAIRTALGAGVPITPEQFADPAQPLRAVAGAVTR